MNPHTVAVWLAGVLIVVFEVGQWLCGAYLAKRGVQAAVGKH